MTLKTTFARVSLLLISFTLIGCITNKQEDKSSKKAPNIVIILADDLGYKDVGFNGCEDIPTPNIDRIAKGGVKFTDAYVTWAACGPSRAGLLTGRYQYRFGFARNPLFAPNDSTMGLPINEMILPEALNQVGYKSVVLGKWHMGAHPSQRPNVRGFDDFYGFLTGGHTYFPETWVLADEYEVQSQYEAYRTKLLRNTSRVEENEYLTDALSREAASYIEQYNEDPFMIYLAYNAPHAPLQATEKYLSRFSHIKNKKRRTYAAMVSAVDDGVGMVLNKLEEQGLDDNTLVIFLSDNGGPETKNGSNNGALRGAKGDLFEGGVRVPFAMKWPKEIPAGLVYEKPISSLDIFATAVAPHGDKISLKNELDGVNLIPFLKNKSIEDPHKELFWEIHDKQEYAIRIENKKYLRTPSESYVFDLENDQGEAHNQYYNETSKDLKAKLEMWEEQMLEPTFLGLRQNKEYNKSHPDRFKRPIK